MSDWRGRAACKGWDPALFFLGQGERPTIAVQELCRDCPVASDCLAFALSLPMVEQHGYYAGTTAQQRMKMKKRGYRRPTRAYGLS